MILLIDNYDSFSYNLYQLIGAIEPDIETIRNDEMSVEEIREMKPAGIIISPGPGRPADAGILEELVRELGDTIPILGVCLGEQGICEAYGAEITYARELMHGKQSPTRLDVSSELFRGLPEVIPTARYHSLAADEATMPECLRITARADDGEIMAVEHTKYPVFGVQFHPESIMTPDGSDILKNFIDITGEFTAE
ncbi:MAG: aminodeoxychorismate/anthranilate synthase component II [Lachnospiraceae bacterium]|nr:aminodeoxychorismate/anthranilate synthase component II [Lachnospiraceae bacterium]